MKFTAGLRGAAADGDHGGVKFLSKYEVAFAKDQGIADNGR